MPGSYPPLTRVRSDRLGYFAIALFAFFIRRINLVGQEQTQVFPWERRVQAEHRIVLVAAEHLAKVV